MNRVDGEERKNSGSNKKTKLKGPKINLTSERNTDGNNKSIITKLKPWKEFFDIEEFKTGLDEMKKSKQEE